ncbi:hypothetical protein SAMN04487785_11530 [Dyella jiangningensis]|nr:hypothetical protein BDW41_105118 [Dyella sp. AtDHG13]SDL13386.1 hypothetical protein SAMN04487785_11530 [Dyella jiangningensis]
MKRIVWTVLVLFGLASPTVSAQGLNGVVTAYVDLYAGPTQAIPPSRSCPQAPASPSRAARRAGRGAT